jgi:hypothetical protein
MNRIAEAIGAADARATRQVLADYLALTKPRLVTMVVITAAVGFYLGAPGPISVALFLNAMIGTALAGAGALALNQYLERDLDACMDRTRSRPLPAGRVQPLPALLFGGALTVLGLGQLLLLVNPLACAVTAVTSAVYLFMYTPLKRVTPLCTIVGAVPGALPPVTGWVAARGEFGDGALVLFAILFLWQIPHSLAIAPLSSTSTLAPGFRQRRYQPHTRSAPSARQPQRRPRRGGRDACAARHGGVALSRRGADPGRRSFRDGARVRVAARRVGALAPDRLTGLPAGVAEHDGDRPGRPLSALPVR